MSRTRAPWALARPTLSAAVAAALAGASGLGAGVRRSSRSDAGLLRAAAEPAGGLQRHRAARARPAAGTRIERIRDVFATVRPAGNRPGAAASPARRSRSASPSSALARCSGSPRITYYRAGRRARRPRGLHPLRSARPSSAARRCRSRHGSGPRSPGRPFTFRFIDSRPL